MPELYCAMMKTLLVSALLALTAAAGAQTQAPGIGEERLAKLMAVKKGELYGFVPGPDLCAALKIPGGKHHTKYYLRDWTDSDGVLHRFAHSSGLKDYVFIVQTKSAANSLRTDAAFKLIARSGALSDAEAAALLARELALWDRHAASL